jgi:hypothetical protein
VTATVIVQVELADMLPPLNVSVSLPAVPPATLPPHVLVRAGVAATTRPDGNASVKPTLVNGNALAFVTVRVRVDVPLAAMVVGLKDLVRVGSAWACRAGNSINSNASSRFIPVAP